MKTGSPTKSIPIFTQFFLPSLACFFLQCQLDLSITVVCLIGLRSINRSIAVFASICFTAASKYGCEVWWKFIKNSTQLRTHFASRYRSKLESWWTLHHPPRNDPAEHYLPHLVLCCRLAHPSTLHSVTLSVTLLRPRAKSEKEILDAERKVSKKKKGQSFIWIPSTVKPRFCFYICIYLWIYSFTLPELLKSHSGGYFDFWCLYTL